MFYNAESLSPIGWLNVFDNAESLSPKRYWRGPRFPEVCVCVCGGGGGGGDRERSIPNAMLAVTTRMIVHYCGQR